MPPIDDIASTVIGISSSILCVLAGDHQHLLSSREIQVIS